MVLSGPMGSYTATYRIPKERVAVRMLLRNGAVRRFELFLPIQPERRPPGQILRKLLEQERPFFPGRDLDGEEFVLLHRDAVVWAELEKDPERELGHLELYDHRVRVRVELAVGSPVEGDVYYTAPSAQTRLMDHLNGPERFLFVHSGGRLVLVNKRFIDFVTELPRRSSTQQLPAVSEDDAKPDAEPDDKPDAEPDDQPDPKPETEESRGED